MAITVQVPTNIRPFHVDIPDQKLADLHRRIAAPATTVGAAATMSRRPLFNRCR
jgi:hypothetical protein